MPHHVQNDRQWSGQYEREHQSVEKSVSDVNADFLAEYLLVVKRKQTLQGHEDRRRDSEPFGGVQEGQENRTKFNKSGFHGAAPCVVVANRGGGSATVGPRKMPLPKQAVKQFSQLY